MGGWCGQNCGERPDLLSARMRGRAGHARPKLPDAGDFPPCNGMQVRGRHGRFGKGKTDLCPSWGSLLWVGFFGEAAGILPERIAWTGNRLPVCGRASLIEKFLCRADRCTNNGRLRRFLGCLSRFREAGGRRLLCRGWKAANFDFALPVDLAGGRNGNAVLDGGSFLGACFQSSREALKIPCGILAAGL